MGLRILVCGGREYDDYETLSAYLDNFHEPQPIVIITGDAKGADFLGRVYAKLCGFEWIEFKAEWKKYGKAAGPIRNQQMLDKGKPDLVIAFPGGTGTADMVRRAKAAGVEVEEVEST